MHTTTQIFGRERELSELDIAMGSGEDGLRHVALAGPSGIGKTTLLRAGLEVAAARGFRIASAHGRVAAMATPFGPWLEALPELEPALARFDGAQDMEQIGVALVAILAGITAEQPLMLSFDDAHALDESSLALLPYAAGVSERMNLTLVLVERSDAGDASSSYRALRGGLLARRVVQNIDVRPLSDTAVSELLMSGFDMDPEASATTEIVLRSQGNPWFAKELASALQLGGTNEIPVNIAAAATSRLGTLTETAQDIVYAIALCPNGAQIGWLEALAGEKPRDFARTMDTVKGSGLIREDDDFVSIIHPLMRQALSDELSAAMRRALHIELVDVIAETPMGEVAARRAQGYHLFQAGKADEAVEQFLKAAEVNEILGQLHEAAADYARALDAEPRIEQRASLLKNCAYAAMHTGSDRAIEYWTELGRIAAARNDNETYAYSLFQQYWTSFDGSAVDRLERAASLGPDTYGWSARAAATLCNRADDYEGGIPHDTRALELARASGDRLLEMLALEKLGTSYGSLGRIDESADSLRQAVALGVANRFHGWTLNAWPSLAETLKDNLETRKALSEVHAALKYVDDLELTRYRPGVLAYIALAHSRCGSLEEALRVADEAFTLSAIFPMNEDTALIACVRARVAVEAGDIGLAGSATEHALEAVAANGDPSWMFEASFYRARYLALSGDVAGALTLAMSLEVGEPLGMANLGLWLARTALFHERPDALAHARGLRAAIVNPVPVVDLMLSEIDAIGTIADGGKSDVMKQVAENWRAGGRDLDAARASTAIAIALLRAKKSKEAISAFTQCRAEFVRIGAQGDADYVSRQLRGLGTRSRAKSRSTEVADLTKRELQISRLVASGLRNSEVAGQLFLAEKTVAAHLSNIYNKVNVRSRVQLASWLKENDPEMMSVVA